MRLMKIQTQVMYEIIRPIEFKNNVFKNSDELAAYINRQLVLRGVDPGTVTWRWLESKGRFVEGGICWKSIKEWVFDHD